jgi:hypothetical protein
VVGGVNPPHPRLLAAGEGDLQHQNITTIYGSVLRWPLNNRFFNSAERKTLEIIGFEVRSPSLLIGPNDIVLHQSKMII